MLLIMKKPTISNAGAVAYLGTMANTGINKIARRNKNPVTMAVNPVRPPLAIPDADST